MAASKSALYWRTEKEQAGSRGQALIEFDDAQSTLIVTKEGTKLLSQLKKNRHLNTMFIFGNARSGKSFLMNCLSGVHGLFKVINSATPCTKGVDISTSFISHSKLTQHVNTYAQSAIEENENMDIGYIDVEGQGDRDGTYDTMLALPLLLTSKVVLFNHKGAPTVTDMLTKLGVLARAADYIDLEDKTTSKPTPATSEQKKFGHLHVVFRDFSFEGDREDVYEQLMGKEKVVKVVAKSDGSKNGNDPAKAAKERNDIRGLLIDNFLSISVWLFKQPASADHLRDNKELPADLVDSEFVDMTKDLLEVVTRQMSEPTLCHGHPLNGTKMHQFIGQITEQLNQGGAINVPSVFHAMEKESVLRVFEACLADFMVATEQLRAKMPHGANQLGKLHAQALTVVVRKFLDELRDCMLDTEKAQSKVDLEKRGIAVIEALGRDNRDALIAEMKKVILEKFNETRINFDSWCKRNIPLSNMALLEEQFQFLQEKAIAAIHFALKSLEGCTQSEEFEMLLVEGQENLQEFLTLKTMQNDSANKDAAISKLREEAIKQQEQLIEQNKKLQEVLGEEKTNTKEMENKLARMKAEREEELRKNKETEEIMKKQQEELQRLRKKRLCVIL